MGSQTATSEQGWLYPFPRLEAMLADLWDVAAPHTYKKPKPYPRPFPEVAKSQRHGNAAGRTPEEVKELLRRARMGMPEAPV